MHPSVRGGDISFLTLWEWKECIFHFIDKTILKNMAFTYILSEANCYTITLFMSYVYEESDSFLEN